MAPQNFLEGFEQSFQGDTYFSMSGQAITDKVLLKVVLTSVPGLLQFWLHAE